MFAHVVTARDFIADNSINTAIFQIHECGNKVRILLDFFYLFLEEGAAIHIFFGGAGTLRTDDLAGHGSFIFDVRSALLHEDNLTVIHVRVGEQHVFLALLGDVQAIPENVYAAALEFSLFTGPVNSLELHFAAQTLAGFLGQVNIKAHDFIALILEAHRREVIIEPHHDFLACVTCFIRSIAAAASRYRHSHHRCQPQREKFLSFLIQNPLSFLL